MSAPERVIEADSAAQKHIGYVVHIFADRSEALLKLEPQHLNRNGKLHGGLISLLIDSSSGYAASRALSDDADAMVVTVSLTTNYLAPADGTSVRAIGRVVRAGRSIVHTTGEIVDENGVVLATGSGVFKAVKSKA
ncbi:PaaI family thioesterase [Pseudahrensia aquimaris]|uniref:PaaI family thioesterase n=1 Tax=Pseudahrensia aquimaris TaxID=744461 RepID=A0ABW3FE22_9HYPH